MDFVNKCFKGHSFRKYFLKIFYGKVKEQPIFLTILYIFFYKSGIKTKTNNENLQGCVSVGRNYKSFHGGKMALLENVVEIVVVPMARQKE